jgi:hypothetical protein
MPIPAQSPKNPLDDPLARAVAARLEIALQRLTEGDIAKCEAVLRSLLRLLPEPSDANRRAAGMD